MPIRKTTKGWKIENVKATFKSRKKAEAALRAIKASQAARQKGKHRGG